MEAFTGSLAHYRLSFLMPALLEEKLFGGKLRLERGALIREFTFRSGCLVAQSSNAATEHLAQVLVDFGVLDAQLAASAFDVALDAGVPFGTHLVNRGFLDRARLVDCLEHKARQAFFDCYRWESGEISYSPGAARQQGGIDLEIPAGPLHRDAMERVLEWRAFDEIFPDRYTGFEVHRECAAAWGTATDQALMSLAERGRPLEELLASSREGPLYAARRILAMYRRGVLSPSTPAAPKAGESIRVEELVDLARRFFEEGDFEHAAAMAAQAVERAAVPEAQALYRQAELRLTEALAEKLFALEGHLAFEPMPRPAPPQLTADDLFLYTRLQSARSLRQALRKAPMGELAAFRSMQKLMDAGVISSTRAPSTSKRHRTEPQWPAA